MRRLLGGLALGWLLVSGAAQAKVLVVSELSATAAYTTNGELNTEVNKRMLAAVLSILDRYGADYEVLPKEIAKTAMCGTGLVYYDQVPGTASLYDYIDNTNTEQFDAVIHVGFNGGQASSPATPYRPDSLTLTAAAPTVPQLLILDDAIGANDQASFNNTTSDSTWADATGYLASGSGTGNHEGEGSVFIPDNDYRWFDVIFGSHVLKKASQPTGGMRVLMAGGANATFTNLNLTGNLPLFADSLSTATADTMKVWEKLNAHKSGAARVVFASASSSIPADSTTLFAYPAQGINWPVLLFAIAHLDSLAGGEVLGSSKVLRWGSVMVGGGTTSDRRHPGGFFLADSNIVSASCDSIGTLNLPIVVGADPESLVARPWQVAIFNRMKSNRYAPWVRHGIDSAAAGNGNASLTSPRDPWGRYRNRAIYGDSANHTVSGSDTSVFANISAARKLLAAQVGANRMSTTLLPVDFDWSPYQLRAHQNAKLADSLLWLVGRLGGPLVINSQSRDHIPAYLRTNPVGWNLLQGSYPDPFEGRTARLLATSGFTVRGSRVGGHTDGLSFVALVEDSTAPYLSSDPGPNASVVAESRFWNGFFGPSRDYQFDAYDALAGTDVGVYSDAKNKLYGQNRASLVVLPIQSLGGQDASGPNRWGFFVLKHLVHATRAINAKAWRTIIAPAYPEEIEP